MSSVFVGIDWAKDAHRVCIVDEAGRIVQQFAVQHDRDKPMDAGPMALEQVWAEPTERVTHLTYAVQER